MYICMPPQVVGPQNNHQFGLEDCGIATERSLPPLPLIHSVPVPTELELKFSVPGYGNPATGPIVFVRQAVLIFFLWKRKWGNVLFVDIFSASQLSIPSPCLGCSSPEGLVYWKGSMPIIIPRRRVPVATPYLSEVWQLHNVLEKHYLNKIHFEVISLKYTTIF